MNTPDWRARLAIAEERIEHGRAEQEAGADDKARIIAEEVAARGRGIGRQEVAAELGVTLKTIDQAIARSRTAATRTRGTRP